MRKTRVKFSRGPVQCSGAARPPRFRCPRTPSAGSSALALGLLALGIALAGTPVLAQTVCTPTDTPPATVLRDRYGFRTSLVRSLTDAAAALSTKFSSANPDDWHADVPAIGCSTA